MPKSPQRLDLTARYVSDADLRGWDLRESDLTGAKFHRVSLEGSDLRGATLFFADFYHVDFKGADLRGCRMHQVVMQDCVLADARLALADLSYAYVHSNNFNRADLSMARIAGMKAPLASFDGANLTGAVASDETYLGAATFRDANLTMAALAGVSMPHADLRGACLSGADLRGADLSHADLRGADLREAQLEGIVAIGATLDSAQRLIVDLRGCEDGKGE